MQKSKRSILPEQVLFENMKPWVFYTSTVLLYGLVVVGGLFINDLGLIFELITAFSLSFLSFIWPGWFYLKASSKYGNPNMSNKLLHKIHAWF